MRFLLGALLFVSVLAVNYQTSILDMATAKKTTSKYRMFKYVLQNSVQSFVVPGLAQGFVPQGFGETKDWFLITSYYNKYNSDESKKSKLFVVSRSNGKLVKTLTLPTSGHVGGVAGTETDIYVCNGEAVGRIPISEVKSAKDGASISFTKTLGMKTTCSFLSYYNKTLYAGVFNEKEKGTAYAYTIGKDSLTPTVKYVIPKKSQGMAWISDKEVVISQSYGRNVDSSFLVYTLKESEYHSNSIDLTHRMGKYYKRIVAPPMSENIFRSVHDGLFYAIFESGSDYYYSAPKKAKKSYCKRPMDKIVTLPVGNLLDRSISFF